MSAVGGSPQDIQVSLTALPQGQPPPTATPATAAAASVSLASVPTTLTPPPTIAVPGIKSCEHALENGLLHVIITKNDGTLVEKYFKITAGITNPALAKKIMDAYQQSGALKEIADKIIMNEAVNASLPVTSPSKQMKLKLIIREDHFEVRRVSKETGVEDATLTQTVQLGTLAGDVTQKAKATKALGSTFEKARDQIRVKHQLANCLKQDGFSPATVKATIAKIFEEGQLGLVRDVEDDFADVTLSDLLQYPNNEALFGALSDLKNNTDLITKVSGIKQRPTNEKSEKLCRQAILDVLLPHVHRPPRVIVDRDDQGKPTYAIHQRVYQGTREPGALHPREVTDLTKLPALTTVNRGYSSESDKRSKENPKLAAHNTNLGAVLQQVPNVFGFVVNVRSGKSGSLARLQELAEFALSEELRFSNSYALRPIGVVGKDPPVYEFRPAINAHVNESDMLEITKACDEWPPEGYRVQIEVDGVLSEVVLRKPIVSNQQVTVESGQKRTDAFNAVANQQYLYDFIRDNPVGADLNMQDAFKGMQDAAKALNAALVKKLGPPAGGSYLTGKDLSNPLSELIDFDKVKLTKFYEKSMIDDKAFIAYEQAVAIFLLRKLTSLEEAKNVVGITQEAKAKLEEIKKITIALYAIHFRRLPPEAGTEAFQQLFFQATKEKFQIRPESSEEQLHAADLEIFRNMLCFPALGAGVKKTQCVQCENGVDRTGIGTALAVAQARFRTKFHRTFLPGQKMQLPLDKNNAAYKDLLHFKKFFREAIHELAVPMVVESTGFSGLQRGEDGSFLTTNINPLPLKYLFLEDDFPHLKPVLGEERAVHDVVGLNYQDLQAPGDKRQYKGSLHASGGDAIRARQHKGVEDSFYLQSTDERRKAVAERQSELNPVEGLLEPKAAYQARKREADRIKNSVRIGINAALIRSGVEAAGLPTRILNDGLQLACHISELNLTKDKIDRLEEDVRLRQKAATLGPLSKEEVLLLATLKRIIAIAKRAQQIQNNQSAVEGLAKGVPPVQLNAVPAVSIAPGGAAADQARLNQFSQAEADAYESQA